MKRYVFIRLEISLKLSQANHNLFKPIQNTTTQYKQCRGTFVLHERILTT